MSAAENPSLRIITTAIGPSPVVRLTGDLDLATAGLLRGTLRELLAGERPSRNLTLDLAGLDFLDVTGLDVLLDTQRIIAAGGGGLTLRSPRPMVVRMLRLLKLDGVVAVES